MIWDCSSDKVRIGALLLALAVPACAFPGIRKGRPQPPKLNRAEQSLQAYLQSVKDVTGEQAPPQGSLWTGQGPISDLSSDYKARNVNDLIVIRIMESTSASGTGQVKTSRDFSASSGISGFFGNIGPTSGLQTLFSPNSTRTLNGQAASSSSDALTTSLTGRVVEVLPNGVMVVEAVRNIIMNDEQQTLIVRGLVRPGDVAADNSVLSTQVGALSVQLVGHGVLSEGTAPPNIVTRLLLKILGF